MSARSSTLLALHLLILGAAWPSPASAEWVANGVPVCRALDTQDGPQIAADGAGGAFIVWRDNRDWTTNLSDIYAQRITAAGTVAPEWPVDGIRVGPADGPLYLFDIESDAEGGAYVLWGNGTDIFVQRLTAAGQVAPGWPSDGFPACTAPGFQWRGRLAPDGAGGVYVVWEDGVWFYGVDLFASRITPAGTLAPGWVANGIVLCDAPDDQVLPGPAADGSGGLLVVWTDRRGFQATHYDVYGVRLTAEGTVAPGWQPGGTPICRAVHEQSPQGHRPISDGEGGMIVAWADTRHQTSNNGADIYAQRMTGEGQVAPGWPVDGLSLCTLRGLQWNAPLVPDGAGGAYVAWEDYRNYDESAADVYAQRVLGNGVIAPGWPLNGLPLIRQRYWDTYVGLVGDGSGGTYAVCNDDDGDMSTIFAQRVTSAGSIAAGWEPQGRGLSQIESVAIYPRAVGDGGGGMIVAWQGWRDLVTDWDIYAQWVAGPRPTASTPRVTGAGHRRLVAWTLSEPSPGTEWAVLKSKNGGPFEVASSMTAGAGTEMSWEDHSPPGGVLRYRIRRESENPNYATESADATWPPQAKPLALSRPAGAGRAGELELSGAAEGPVDVKVFDVQGRLVLERRAAVGANGEALRLDFSSELRSRGAGIYFARALDGSGRPTTPVKLVLLK